MSADEEARVRHIYERWHATITGQDLGGLMALYAEHAVFESPTVLAQFPERDDGILRGRAEIEKLFARNFTNLRKEFRELYRTGLFFSNGRHLTWEYPRQTPSGAQVDLFESMDIENGLIVYHRVYWGWQASSRCWRCATGAPSESRLFFFVLGRAIFRATEEDAMSWMDEAMKDLRPWIGRVRTVEDDVGLMAVRRAAGTFNVDPAKFSRGTELPPHWFSFFGVETVLQSEIGPDGHAKKGVVLPPIPMPRRMGAGRRVKVMGRLRAGEPATKKAEVADIVPKSGRSGDIFVLTMRHTYEQAGKTLAVDEMDAIYRQAVPAGQKTTATVPTPARTDQAWSERTELSNTLNFRFSALTWNAHRIHYDGDYTRSEEGYPAIVSNGGLSMHLMVDAALRHAKGTLTSYTTRLVHPLWVGDSIEVRGEEQKDGKLRIWAADKNGVLCGEMDLEFAP